MDLDTWRLVTKVKGDMMEVEHEQPKPRQFTVADIRRALPTWANRGERAARNMHDVLTGQFFLILAGMTAVHFSPWRWRDRILRGPANHTAAVTSEQPAIGV